MLDAIFLDLSMRRSFVFSFVFLVSCHQAVQETNGLLLQPPYQIITDSLQQSPRNPDLYYRRGVLLFEANENELAKQDIRTAWELQPKEIFALSLAIILQKDAEDSAILFLQSSIQKLPQSIAVKVALAKDYQKKNDTDKAINLCNQIIISNPNQLDALILKADLLQAKHKDAEALQLLERAYRYAPSDLDLVHNLSFAYALAKNSKVLSLSDSLLHKDTSGRHAEPYYFKGLYYENIGSPVTALGFLNEAIHHDYYFLDAYMEKGQILYNQKQFSAALKTFQLAATITPTFADAYYWVGKSLEALHNKADARLNYERAYSLNKNLTEAKEASSKL